MGTSAQIFSSTPAFELFRRGLTTQSIQSFRGLNAYTSIALLGPEYAQDLLNVFVPGSGNLSKLRLPVTISTTLVGQTTGPNGFWDFQQANGTRLVLVQFGNKFYTYSNDLQGVPQLVDNNVLNSGMWSFVTANNILFGANGNRVRKLISATAWEQWGIAAPTATPNVSSPAIAISASRTSNVVTVTVPGASARMPQTGDTILLSSMTDTSFNGYFNVTGANYGALTFTFSQTAANSTATGNLTLFSYTLHQAISTINRTSGVVIATVGNGNSVAVGDSLIVSGVTDSSFNGNFTATAATSTQISWVQGGQDGTSSGGTVDFGLLPTIGYSWAYAYGNSVTGHVSNIGPTNITFGNVISAIGRKFAIQVQGSSDSQVDTYYLFRTLDGGSDYFFEQKQSAFSFSQFQDSTLDSQLNQTLRGPLINNVPIVGNYTAFGQSRVFIANLLGAPQDIIYSGYEQIFLGRPEESFPPNNRLRLSIGAESIAGIGVLQAGVVAFSQTNRMYMLRGAVNDITLAQPVAFSDYLEELPWTLGCASHFTIQNTPYGLVWLAGDKTVQVYNGHGEPIDISYGVYPLLQQITPGTEKQCVAGYFNWLERDVYVLLAAVQGSLTINRLFFFAFNKAPGSNQIQSVELFVSDIPVEIMASDVSWVGLITSSTLQRKLCIGTGGVIQQLPISSDTTNGLVLDPTIIPATGGQLTARWKGGYFGNDQPQRSKLWRFMQLLTDQDPSMFQATARYVDYKQRSFLNPEVVGPIQFDLQSAYMGMNNRAHLASVEIIFPNQDVSANVLELQVAQISTSDRP